MFSSIKLPHIFFAKKKKKNDDQVSCNLRVVFLVWIGRSGWWASAWGKVGLPTTQKNYSSNDCAFGMAPSAVATAWRTQGMPRYASSFFCLEIMLTQRALSPIFSTWQLVHRKLQHSSDPVFGEYIFILDDTVENVEDTAIDLLSGSASGNILYTY